MKTLGKLIFSAAAVLAMLASTAKADVTVRITGSTAFRSAVHNALINILGAGCKAAYNGSSLSGANQAVFTGAVKGVTGVVTVETDWTGSLSGINALANNPTAGTGSGQLTFIDSTAIPATGVIAPVAGSGPDVENSVPTTGTSSNPDGSVPPPFGLTQGPSGGNPVTAVFTGNTPSSFDDTSGLPADIALSDAAPTSTPYSGTGNPITATNVGVVPFIWVKSAADSTDGDYSTYKRLTNITAEEVSNIVANGYLGASDITGNTGDANAYIYVSGRDEDSGTRFDALAEAYNDNSSIEINQLEFAGSNTTAGTVTGGTLETSSLVLPPPNPASNVGGYNSGGTLAKWLQAKGIDPSFTGYVVAYLGCADAEALVAPFDGTGVANTTVPATYVPGKVLTYNGVTVSNAAVSSGAYQFWIFEHYLVRSSGTGSFTSTSDTGTVSSALFTQLENHDATVAGYLLSSVAATKSKEGALIGAP
jgi:hypothetical protein